MAMFTALKLLRRRMQTISLRYYHLPIDICIISVLFFVPACRTRIIDGFPGDFTGVGLEINIATDGPRVVKVINGGAAANAGMQSGDLIVAVDDDDMLNKNLGDVVMKLRGKPKSQVAVTVERKGRRIIFVMQRQQMQKTNGTYRAIEN
ncbi:MAG: PDZ domain-containing protein [Deltaproteobacteria bacterium]|nr:PDZ domain-containing protein [Deltaproteobacteria bacterium]